MNILAIDYGSKRVGLAWVDTNLGVVLPFGLIEKATLREKIKELSEIIQKERLNQIVVGFPFDRNGKENANTEKVKKFVFELQKNISIPIEYFDERFSSQGADAMGDGVSRDEKSAMILLEGYLQRNKNKGR
ncbi:MAG: Holliday junction resolvase RuvX [Patescibacteria group bacterium]|jgi:putative Holliday junction resolvase